MSDPALLFVILCAISCVAIALLYKYSLLSLGKASGRGEPVVALMSPLIGFLLFLGICAFVPVWVQKAIHYLDTHGFSSFSKAETDSLSQFVTLAVACILLMGFSRIHPEDVRETIWGAKSPIKSFGKGMLYCGLTYPIVMALVQGIHLGLDWLGKNPLAEQVALVQLKALRSYPWLFWTMALAVITLVPLVEEFLFRGLLQTYLGGLIGAKGAIFFTSLLFSLFHYASEQATTNYELMAGLFLYSYFIGICYVREGTLWTPIAMHASFNGLSLCLLLYV